MGSKCVWCGICAKYLAFGTYPTSTVGVLIYIIYSSLGKQTNIYIYIYIYIYAQKHAKRMQRKGKQQLNWKNGNDKKTREII